MRGHLLLRSTLRWLVLLAFASACTPGSGTPELSATTSDLPTDSPNLSLVTVTFDSFDEPFSVDVVLPEGVRGKVVPPPDKSAINDTRPKLEGAIFESKLDPTPFNLDLVTFAPEQNYYAVPTNESFSGPVDDVVVGLWFDVKAQTAYEVRVSGQQVILSNPRDDTKHTVDAREARQHDSAIRSLAFFVEGSCWVCFTFDGRSICFGC